MRLGLSKKGDPRGRHLMLVANRTDGFNAKKVIEDKVLPNANPVYDYDPERHQFVYRFHMRYLERLMLVFPFVDLSPGLDKWMVAQQRKEYTLSLHDALPIYRKSVV